jgi:hypothetical protein
MVKWYMFVDTPLFTFVFPNLIPDVLPVSQQFLVLVQLSIMFSNGLGDSVPSRLKVIKCLHHQLDFSHVAGCIWYRPYILPCKFNLSTSVTQIKDRKHVTHLRPMDCQIIMWIEGIR